MYLRFLFSPGTAAWTTVNAKAAGAQGGVPAGNEEPDPDWQPLIFPASFLS